MDHKSKRFTWCYYKPMQSYFLLKSLLEWFRLSSLHFTCSFQRHFTVQLLLSDSSNSQQLSVWEDKDSHLSLLNPMKHASLVSASLAPSIVYNSAFRIGRNYLWDWRYIYTLLPACVWLINMQQNYDTV